MTQSTGQPAHICEKNLLAAIKELGKDAKLLPIKTKLNSMRETASCPFGTLAQVKEACMAATTTGCVQKMDSIYALTSEGADRLSRLAGQRELEPA